MKILRYIGFSLLIILFVSGILYQFLAGKEIDKSQQDDFFTVRNYSYLKSPKDSLSFKEILALEKQGKFTPITKKNILVSDTTAIYWEKVLVSFKESRFLVIASRNFSQSVAMYDSAIDSINPVRIDGYSYSKSKRIFPSNQPIFLTKGQKGEKKALYFKYKLFRPAPLSVSGRPVTHVVRREVLSGSIQGIFFGGIIIIIAYSLILYIALRENLYLLYCLYLVSLSCFALVDWGFFFQFANIPLLKYFYEWYAIPYSFITIFLLAYTRKFFYTPIQLPKMDKVIKIAIVLKLFILIIGISFRLDQLYNPLIDTALLFIAFVVGIIRLRKGFKPARYFLLGFAFLFTGLSVHAFNNYLLIPQKINLYLSIYNTGILEVILFSVALADRLRSLKESESRSYQTTIKILKENQQLKDAANKALEDKVKDRTKELEKANVKLKKQSEEIRNMNRLLRKENVQLEQSVISMLKARVMQRPVTFSEFKQFFPNENICYKYLSDIKWKKGYSCQKCGNKKYASGKTPFSRRCSKCNYIEPVTKGTIFYNVRFSILKAFYILFVTGSGKDISGKELSEELDLRKETCNAFKRKVKNNMTGAARRRHKKEWIDYVKLNN